jgi:hypothetical protein
VIGKNLYVLGGVGGSGTLGTVERAPLDADSVLGKFEIVSDVTIGGRHGHTVAYADNYLYLLGGSDDIRFLDYGERASLNVSGSLGPFAVIPGITLTLPRAHCASVVLGNYLYVLGGAGDPTRVERSSINADGTLGSFSLVPGVVMANPRDGLTTAVIENYLYVFGGFSNSIERANIGLDGSLGAFETVSASLVTTRIGLTATVSSRGYLYINGGISSNDPPAVSIERATIGSDGSLGAFSTFPGGDAIARDFLSTPVIGDYIYVLGGSDAITGGNASDVYRSSLNTSGSGALDPFQIVSNITLGAQGPIIVEIGNYLYAFGFDAVVQRAHFDTAGSLGSLETLADVSAPARFAPASIVVGNHLYVVGGAVGRNPINSIEQADLK